MTLQRCICHLNEVISLCKVSDVDLGGDLNGRKNTVCYVFTSGATSISWKSKHEGKVSHLTINAEYIAISKATNEMIGLKNLLKELGKEKDDFQLFSDNKSVICLSKNPTIHSRRKNIELRYHFIRNVINDEDLFLLKIQVAEDLANMLSKTVTINKLRLCIPSIGLQEN